MNKNLHTELSNFFVAGINYKKTDTGIRGSFAIGTEQYSNMLGLAAEYGVRDFFVLSTCNRSEIYGIAEQPAHLVNLFARRQGLHRTFS
jgi:glutamyl-tRNA reductase